MGSEHVPGEPSTLTCLFDERIDVALLECFREFEAHSASIPSLLEILYDDVVERSAGFRGMFRGFDRPSAARFAFSEAGSELHVHVPTGVYLDSTALGPDATYRIVGEASRVMRMQMVGEVRRTETGDLVVWDLVLLDADSFCWRRVDWPPEACTKRLTRCEVDRAGS